MGKKALTTESTEFTEIYFFSVFSVNSVVKSFLLREDEWGVHEGVFNDMDGEAVGVRDGFGGEDFARGADGGEMSADEQGNSVSVAGGEVKIVQCDEHGEVFGVRQLADQFQQADLILQIQMGGGFIEQENGCGLAQGAGEQNPLRFSA